MVKISTKFHELIKWNDVAFVNDKTQQLTASWLEARSRLSHNNSTNNVVYHCHQRIDESKVTTTVASKQKV